MAQKSDIQKVLRSMGNAVKKAKTIYGLSDGHIYIDSNASAISKIASQNNLEIFAIKGPEIKLKSKEKDVATGS
jgi:hypothetical protein